MGLTAQSVRKKALFSKENKCKSTDYTVALAGNPNVGKSSLFNLLTGLHQHTGNWPGKTVTCAQGICEHRGKQFCLVDLPGTYSLLSRSPEEEVARDFICNHPNDAVIVVCDATCLERNLNLTLQILELTNRVVVCVNLIDEAQKKQIQIDFKTLSSLLGVPVVASSIHDKNSVKKLMNTVETLIKKPPKKVVQIPYPKEVKDTIMARGTLNSEPKSSLLCDSFSDDELNDHICKSVIGFAGEIAEKTVTFKQETHQNQDRKIDRFLTGKRTGVPVMILLLALVFWITLAGANYPSGLLSAFFVSMEEKLLLLAENLNVPPAISQMLFCGIFRVVGWIVSVMLPPMAIFFPLFTLLEDLGYLPRIAFNLDKTFQKCRTCGKQGLTMCMGFGCNAAGVVGARIIDSKRERLIAIITNSLVPCNGRFPAMIAMITMFFAGSSRFSSLYATLCLTGVVLLGIAMTFFSSRILSATLLKGEPSSFAMELPPYRKPRIATVLIRSVFDRTLFVLGRALLVAAPAGLIIWFFANVSVGNHTILRHFCNLLDAPGRFLGMDGVILMAFLLGLPANEIVIPVMMMTYLSSGSLSEAENLISLKELFVANGWTPVTALCTLVFSLFHWPCSTTLITIKKETGSWKWTVISCLLPALIGCVICALIAGIGKMI